MLKPKSPNICLYLFIFTLFFPAFLFSQINETLVITTYYPSPTHSVDILEVKNKLAIGDDSETQITTLIEGQIYVGGSIIFGNSTVLPSNPIRGQIIYNSTIGKLQFYNETGGWVNVGG